MPGAYAFRPMDAASAREIAGWQYPPPYDTYNAAPGEVEEAARALLTPDYRYHSTWDGSGRLVGFVCFGEDARVPGGDYTAQALDVGLGLRPDRTGCGLGAGFLQAALAFGRRCFSPVAFRATVAEFNARSLRVFERAGFRAVQTFEHPVTRRRFVVLIRAADSEEARL